MGKSLQCEICDPIQGCTCLPREVLYRARLSKCRENDCGKYDDGDRCLAMSRPCQLCMNLRQGKKCHLGYHGDLGT